MPEAVGIFWFVGDELVAVVCELTNAVPYGDCLTYDGGHAEHWEAWQKAGASSLRSSGLPERIATSEYEEHPRGRIVKEPDRFFLYADRRLQTQDRLAEIRKRFGLLEAPCVVRSDSHYR